MTAGATTGRPAGRPGARPGAGGDATVGLAEAAGRLGVHYMTAYRYVRTGRLAATKDGSEWRVAEDELARLCGAGQVPPPRPLPRSTARRQLEQRLLAGDELGAWNVVEAALASGAEPVEIHLAMLAPALRSIGERWAAGELSVGEEHLATAAARRVVGRLGPRFTRRGRKRAVVVVGAVAGERHELPGAMLADQLRGAGFEVVDFGADTPPEAFAAAASRLRPLAVLVGATGTGHAEALRTVASAVHDAAEVPVLLGGAGVPVAVAARDLGADGWSGLDAQAALVAVESLLSRRNPRAGRATPALPAPSARRSRAARGTPPRSS
ncbi:MAG: B12-binding domain-containing protein [Actinomycetota bacterium]|nr:B12-binding domain-containing protein [Actinomycetota bacterium]